MKVERLLATAVVAAVFCVVLNAAPPDAAAGSGFDFTYFPHEGLDSEFTNDWMRPRDNGERSHRGNDIFAPKMTRVVAVADGFVTFVGSSTRSGYQVRVRHAQGWETYYIHLNNDVPGTDNNRGGPEFAFAPGLEEGQFVTAGTHIGYVGDSGNAEPTASHTHFELRRYGLAVNPYQYLREALARQQRVHENLEMFGLS